MLVQVSGPPSWGVDGTKVRGGANWHHLWKHCSTKNTHTLANISRPAYNYTLVTQEQDWVLTVLTHCWLILLMKEYFFFILITCVLIILYLITFLFFSRIEKTAVCNKTKLEFDYRICFVVVLVDVLGLEASRPLLLHCDQPWTELWRCTDGILLQGPSPYCGKQVAYWPNYLLWSKKHFFSLGNHFSFISFSSCWQVWAGFCQQFSKRERGQQQHVLLDRPSGHGEGRRIQLASS